MVGCTIASRPCMICMQYDNYVKLYEHKASDEELEELMKDQLLPADASPIALSSGYISDSDPEEDDEEDQRRILLTILPTEETMMIMSHLMMTTMIMMAYAAGHWEKKHYGGSKPLYFKYNYHHNGSCAPKCHKCNRVGHLTRDCKNQGHYMSDCPELKNQNHENGGTGACGVVHALGGGETNQDHNDMEEDINA
ncbi:putative reverse transcriptase domain-containing protein [Tanacetum coccineum]